MMAGAPTSQTAAGMRDGLLLSVGDAAWLTGKLRDLLAKVNAVTGGAGDD